MAVETLRTVCNRDCPDTCGLIATVENGRVIKLSGDPAHPVTDGFICHRTTHFPARHYSPDRITTPLMRDGTGFRPISWEQAIDLAASRLMTIRSESGPASILFYRSGGSLGILKSVVELFFELFGPVTGKRGDICSGAGDTAQITDFGDKESHDFFDILNSKTIILWGKNPTISNVHLVPLLKKARAGGARLIGIDPIRHKTHHLCDQAIRPRPGGDLALALGVAGRLFDRSLVDPEAGLYCDNYEEFRGLARSQSAAAWAEEAGVELDDLDAVASALASRPCSIQVGWGMGRRMQGSAIVRAVDALGAISGNMGIRGGGVSFDYRRTRAFDTSFMTKESARTLLEPSLGQEILDAAAPPIRAVWIIVGNPVAMLPDSATVARALETRDFVVVVDSFMTDTARRAHLVLPTTTLLEDDDVFGSYGHHWLGASTPVVERPEGVLSDLEIVQRLARRVDELSPNGSEQIAPRIAGSHLDWKRRVLAKIDKHGITAERLAREAVRNPLVGDVLWPDRRFKTASGKVNLMTSIPEPPPEEPGYPLWLFSNSTEKAQSSQWAGPMPDPPNATCHPDAAAGFGDGDLVMIESAIGKMRARLRFDATQRKDLVLVPKGGHYDFGTCANALVRARPSDAGEAAAYLDCRVRIVSIG